MEGPDRRVYRGLGGTREDSVIEKRGQATFLKVALKRQPSSEKNDENDQGSITSLVW